MFGLSKRNPDTQSSPAQSSDETARREVQPPVDIHQDADGLTILVDVPGCTREDLTISVDDGVLSLRATPRAVAPQGYQTLHQGLVGTVAVRSFALPDVVEVDRINATVKDGILRLTLPKRSEAKPRRIEVN